MAFVYHIHLPQHTGCFESGYIGFTSNTVEHRWKEHKALAVTEKSRNYPIYNAIRKYGDKLVVTTLHEGSNEYCLDMENRLRPKPNTGWNISCGGGAPMLGMRHAEGTFDNAFPPERRKKMSDFHKAQPTWLHGSSNKAVWASADKVYECFKAHEDIGANLLGKAFNLGTKELEAMRNKFLKGWVPAEDKAWQEWSSKQVEKLVDGWAIGDDLVERSKPELTEELLKARGIGGRTRVWTDEAKENLRKINLGRKHTPETLKKMSEVLTGIRRSDEQKAVIRLRLKERPWTNATAIHDNWAQANYIRVSLSSGVTVADLLREFGFERRSGALKKIVLKIKAGWNPNEDETYLTWLEEYKQKEAVNAQTQPA